VELGCRKGAARGLLAGAHIPFPRNIRKQNGLGHQNAVTSFGCRAVSTPTAGPVIPEVRTLNVGKRIPQKKKNKKKKKNGWIETILATKPTSPLDWFGWYR